MSASLVGQKLGKYEITELLGQGGMATVYKGYQRDVDRFVAVKVLPPHPGQGEPFVERFRLEARTIARLQHPHILPLYDYGDERDILYLVMAYVDGGSLSDRIRRGPLPLAEVQGLFQQIADALDYAHRQNVIHRDIKPDNILLDRDGHALLSDFGIAKIIEEGGTLKLTGTGGLVGTPAYMSPEQAQGLPVDYRTDIYSLGIVVFEMLAGKQPFSADTPMQVVLKHITAPVPALAEFNPRLPAELDAVMQRALQKDPAQRYASAQEFYEDFARVVKGDAPLAPARAPIPTLEPTSPALTPAPLQPTMIAQPAWNPLVLLGGFAIIALLVVAVVALLLNFNRPADNPPSAAALPTNVPVVAPPTLASTPNFGRVTYSTGQSLGDTVQVVVNGLTLPPAGDSYTVALYNTVTHDTQQIGALQLDPLGDGQLSYVGSGVLPIRFNAVLITDQKSAKVVYSGQVPPEVMDALQTILISSPDGVPPATPTAVAPAVSSGADLYATTPEPQTDENSSLLAGALEEANIAMKHAGLAAAADSVGSMRTHAEHTINILNGTYVDYNGDGHGQNPGLGYGIAYFTDRIQAKLDAIANAPDATPAIQSQADLIGVCIVNVHNWMEQVIALETQLLAASDLASVQTQLAQSTQLAAAIVNGVDLNHDGQIEPFEGECGLQQIDDFGISVGNMTLLAGSLPQGG